MSEGPEERGQDHALRVLELDRVLDAVAARATSAQGRAAVQGLRPLTTAQEALAELERVDAVRDRLSDGDFGGVPAIPDADGELSQLVVAGSVLTGVALRRLHTLLVSGRHLAGELSEGGPLEPIRGRLFSDSRAEKALDQALEPDGEVRDQASKELGRIRREIRKLGADLVRALERTMAELPDRYRVADASVTIRAGRYVIPIRREGRSAVGGIVHDQSATGATLFVEPPGQVDRMNRLRELELGEAREVHRVLSELTAELRPHAGALRASLAALVRFDALYARARTADAWAGHLPALDGPDPGALEIVEGRHPLLLERGLNVVPFSLSLEPSERVVVVSGPNTGGKTVFLKTIGLIPLLALCGVVPPVGPGTRVPAFRRFFADIGDEQSIQDDLSTFSAHVANLRRILEEAGPGSLVLMDELGTGTDPAEGAALAQAALEHLRATGALTVATSHLGQLKRLDTLGSGIVNASLQFDAERMEPTYRLVKGRPGRSFGLAIGRRLRVPPGVMERATSLVTEEDARQDDLLERLEREERRARELADRLDRERAEIATLHESLVGRERELEAKERDAQAHAHEEARRVLMEARAEVERAIAQGRAAAGDAETERAARRRLEANASRHRDAAERAERAAPSSVEAHVPVGARVRLAGGAKGTLVDVAGETGFVELDGGIRMNVDLAQLVALGPEERTSKGSVRWTATATEASSEVDLRGLRVDEVAGMLLGAVDRAVLADLPSLRIIHGKGTGAVKARVLELLAEDPRVLEFAPGGDKQGGTGVTVIKLK